MLPYANRSGNSGVSAYEIGPDFIRLQFQSGTSYTYTYDSAGREHVERMKQLAASGRGLSKFLSGHPAVRKGYVK